MSKTVTLARRSIISLSRPFPSSFTLQNPPLFPPSSSLARHNKSLLHNTIPLPSRTYSSSSNQKPFPAISDDAVRCESREEPAVPVDFDFNEVSKDELKKRIDKYLEEEEDVEAIPSLFEAILSRKLAGKHDETDEDIIGKLGSREAMNFEDSDDDDDDLASDSDDD